MPSLIHHKKALILIDIYMNAIVVCFGSLLACVCVCVGVLYRRLRGARVRDSRRVAEREANESCPHTCTPHTAFIRICYDYIHKLTQQIRHRPSPAQVLMRECVFFSLSLSRSCGNTLTTLTQQTTVTRTFRPICRPEGGCCTDTLRRYSPQCQIRKMTPKTTAASAGIFSDDIIHTNRWYAYAYGMYMYIYINLPQNKFIYGHCCHSNGPNTTRCPTDCCVHWNVDEYNFDSYMHRIVDRHRSIHATIVFVCFVPANKITIKHRQTFGLEILQNNGNSRCHIIKCIIIITY